MNPTLLPTLSGAIAGAIGTIVITIALKAMQNGRPWIITLPGTPGAEATIRRIRLTEGTFNRKQGDEAKKFIAAGLAAYPSKMGPIHILTDYGANLIAPSKDGEHQRILEANIKQAEKDYMAAIKERNVPKDEALWNQLLDKARKVSMRFLVWDPLIYWRACKENDTEDYYAAQQGKPHWMEKIAPFLMIAVLALVGLVGFMLWKLLPMISGAAS